MDRPKILYVEDEEMYQTLVREILTEHGFVVEVAGTGAEACRMLERFDPDLLILDINLPDTDGYTLCQGLRKEERWASLPILMLTVRRHPDEWRQGFSAGASDYVSKPLNGPDLVDRVRACLDGKSASVWESDNPEWLMIQAVRSGNRGAFDVFVRQYKEELIKIMQKKAFNASEAEDIVAITFTRAYECLDQFRGDSHFFTWLYCIAKNELTHKRREETSVSLDEMSEDDQDLVLAETAHDEPAPEDSEDPFACQLRTAMQAMSQIPRRFRRPLELHVMEGKSYKTIAKELDLPHGTVMSRLYRGRDHLRKAWLAIRFGGNQPA